METLKSEFKLLLLFNLINLIISSHFHGGSISYKPVKQVGSNVEIEISTHFSWLRSRPSSLGPFYCDQPYINAKGVIGESYPLVCTIGCSIPNLNLTDTSNNLFTTSTICTAFSVAGDWSYGEKKTNILFPMSNDIEVYIFSSAWNTLVVAGNGSTNLLSSLDFELKLTMDTTVRADTGNINNSPTTIMPPIIKLRKGFNHTIKLPVSDADNDIVKCRWAEKIKNECAG
jgi:hypothetical protein